MPNELVGQVPATVHAIIFDFWYSTFDIRLVISGMQWKQCLSRAFDETRRSSVVLFGIVEPLSITHMQILCRSLKDPLYSHPESWVIQMIPLSGSLNNPDPLRTPLSGSLNNPDPLAHHPKTHKNTSNCSTNTESHSYFSSRRRSHFNNHTPLSSPPVNLSKHHTQAILNCTCPKLDRHSNAWLWSLKWLSGGLEIGVWLLRWLRGLLEIWVCFFVCWISKIWK